MFELWVRKMRIKYTNRIELDDGYYIIRTEYFENGWGISGEEQHFSPDNELLYIKKYGNQLEAINIIGDKNRKEEDK